MIKTIQVWQFQLHQQKSTTGKCWKILPQIHKASNCWSTKHRGRTGRRNLPDVGCFSGMFMIIFVINMFYHAFFQMTIYIHLIYISSNLLHVLTLHSNPTSRENPTFLAWDRYRPHQALVIHGASALMANRPSAIGRMLRSNWSFLQSTSQISKHIYCY